MARRPNVQSDRDDWGDVLNEYLGVSLAEDGALREEAVRSVGDAVYADAITETTVTGLQTQVNALAADLDAIQTAPTTLPVTAGLFFHVDAADLDVADGDRVSAWTDRVSGSTQAEQSTEANQPRFDIVGINGRPALYFDTARNDRLVATVAPTSNTVTVIAVMRGEAFATGARYFFGTNGHPKNLYQASTGSIGAQGSSAVVIPSSPTASHIIVGVWNGADSVLRVNGTETTGDTGTQTTVPTQFSIGNRSSAAAANAFSGYIGEVLYYDRVLTAGEITAVETYLDAKWRIPTSSQVTWHVDSVAGTATGSGRTPATAMATLSAAIDGIKRAAPADATVVIHAPEDRPIREPATVTINGSSTVRLVSRTPGQPWYVHGSERFIGDWTDQGGGVYSRALSTIYTSPSAWVPTLLDGDGQPTRIFGKNTDTPTTPAAGEYGYTGGTYYLHLPGDADPNEHTVEVAVVNRLLDVRGPTVVMQDGRLRGAQSNVVAAGTSTEAGYVVAIDCDARYGQSGFGTSQLAEGMRCVRCSAFYNSNDGFNHHGLADSDSRPLMELIDCEGAYNGDEGVSPHEYTRLILYRGRYHHNAYGGLTAVNFAEVQAYAAEFDHNRMHDSNVTGWDSGGVSILDQSRLVSTDLYSHDHPGPGVEIDTASGATWIDNGGTRSGTANGNGAPDVV